MSRDEMRKALKELKNAPPLTSEQILDFIKKCNEFDKEQEEYWDEWERNQAMGWNKMKDKPFTL